MNLNAVVVSQLKKRRAAMVARHAAELAPIDAALSAFGGGTVTESAAPVKRRRRRKLSPEAIAKMQEGRKRAREAAQAGTQTPATPAQPARESRPRLPQGPKGASLAAAAE
jgi:hypothetical protein